MARPTAYQIRRGIGADLPFLWETLRAAACWSGEDGVEVDEIMSEPEIAVILNDWGGPGDTAFVAESDAGRPMGTAWYRLYTRESHSYGFVDEETPELAIAVREEYRNKGVGTLLLERLVAEAASQGVRRLSLSVDRTNHAVRMYEKAGFVNIDDEDDDHWTMVLTLR